jgi:hypothetical protein
MSHRPSSQLRSKILWMGKWRLKMKLRQYSILGDGVESRQVDPRAFFFRKLRPDDESPVIELLADDGRTEAVSGGL